MSVVRPRRLSLLLLSLSVLPRLRMVPLLRKTTKGLQASLETGAEEQCSSEWAIAVQQPCPWSAMTSAQEEAPSRCSRIQTGRCSCLKLKKSQSGDKRH